MARDLQILAALGQFPLTATQLLKLSRTFDCPFTSERRARERLALLAQAGHVRRWHYATAGVGAPQYATLTLQGFRLLHGPRARPLRRRLFSEIGIAQQHHAWSLSEFLVHALVATHAAGISVVGFERENDLQLRVGHESLFPDAALTLQMSGGQRYCFYIEIDGGSEPIRSAKALSAWQRKLRLYDRLQDQSPHRFRVLIISSRRHDRLQSILAAAKELLRNPGRSLFYAAPLPAFLASPAPLTIPCFQDQRGRAVAALPPTAIADARPKDSSTALAVGDCYDGVPAVVAPRPVWAA